MDQTRPKHIPQECKFSDRGAGECWGCPNIFCKHMRQPFQDAEETDTVVLKAAKLVKQGRVRGYRPKQTEIEVAVDLKLELMSRAREFRYKQATEAVLQGFALAEQAARWAGIGIRSFKEHLRDLSNPKARAQEA